MRRSLHSTVAWISVFLALAASCWTATPTLAWAVVQAPTYHSTAYTSDEATGGVVESGTNPEVYEAGADASALPDIGSQPPSFAGVVKSVLGAKGLLSSTLPNRATLSNSDTPALSSGELPSRFDARDQGWVTALVRQQEPWGTCWAISALESMESNMLKKGYTLSDSLSVRQFVWAANTPLPSANQINVGTSGVQLGQVAAQAGEGQNPSDSLVETYGKNAAFEAAGNYYVAYQAMASGRGPIYEGQAPYKNDEDITMNDHYAPEGTWTLGEDYRFQSVLQLRHANVLPAPATYSSRDVRSYSFNTEALDEVKRAIQAYGSVALAYDGNEDYYDDTNATWFSDDSLSTDHGVQIVGWDDSISRELFTTGTYGQPEGDGAWIVRNSWGASDMDFPNASSWGDEGYFYLSYYDRSAQVFVAYDVMPNTHADATDIINQHDFLGQMGQASARLESSGDLMRSANVFTAEQAQTLRAVSADTYASNTVVTVEVYLLGSGSITDPTAGKLVSSQTDTLTYGGYHRIQLNKPVQLAKGQRFSVVETIQEPSGEYTATMEAGNSREAAERWGYYHYDTVVVNEGESFVFTALAAGETLRWIDAVDVAAFLTKASGDNTPYGNICIKAFSDAIETPDKPSQDDKSDDDTTNGSSGGSGTQSGATGAVHTSPASKPVQGHVTARTADTVELGGVLIPVGIVLRILVVSGLVSALVLGCIRLRTFSIRAGAQVAFRR